MARKHRRRSTVSRREAARLIEDTTTDPYPLPEPDANRWMLVSSGIRFVGESTKRVEEDSRVALRDKARKLVRFNPHGRAIMRNFAKYVLGRGVMPRWPDAVDKDVRRLWDDFTFAANWRQRSCEILTRLLRDGEVFIRRFEDMLPLGRTPRRRIVVPRFIDPELVRAPNGTEEDGILTDEEDVETVRGYLKVRASDRMALDERIPTDEVIHAKVECDLNERRGVTPLASVMPFIEMYDSWLVDRMVLSKVRSSVALVRTVDGSATQIKQMLQDEQDHEQTERGYRGESKPVANTGVKQKRFRPGTVINARKGVDYKFISPNLQAADVHHDGRAILLAIAAGTGLAEFMVTADASNNAYASALVSEGPAVKEFQDWQETLGAIYTRIWAWVVERGREAGYGIPKRYDPWTVTWAWPDMVVRNRLNEVQANKIMVEAGSMSRHTMMEKDGLDYRLEKERLVQDQKDLPLPPAIAAKADLATGLKGAPGSPRPFAGKQGGNQAAAGNTSLNDPDVPEPSTPLAGKATRDNPT